MQTARIVHIAIVWLGWLYLTQAGERLGGDVTVTVRGSVDLQEFNPNTGKAYVDQKAHSDFVAVLMRDRWALSVTNKTKADWWAKTVFDGSSTYIFRPSGGEWDGTNVPNAKIHQVSIEGTTRYLSADPDPMGLYMVWMTYGIWPAALKSNSLGLVEMPLPSGPVRGTPLVFGYEWLVNATGDGAFVRDCRVVRNQILDLDDNEELLRPELDYPETIGDNDAYLLHLDIRRRIPSGFLKYRYECNDWLNTNGITLPAVSKLEVYMSPTATNYPVRIINLKAVEVSVMSGPEQVLPPVITTTEVNDYRYKKIGEKRIFKFANYQLKRGDAWKSANDPALLAEQERWLKRGREYRTFIRTRNWITWILAGLTICPLIVWCFVRRNKNNQTKENI